MAGLRWRRLVRPQDFVWLALFSALAALSPDRTADEITLLLILAVFQVVEPRLAYFATPKGQWSAILLKLLASYLLIGLTGGVNSSYYLILLLPVVSAATSLNTLSTLAVVAMACGAYLSFLLFIDWERYVLPDHSLQELALRLVFLAVAGYLTHMLAETSRLQAERQQALADELAEANRSLRKAEAAFRRSERLAALGHLAAGLAHEIRNPLGTIQASSEVLARNLPEGDAVAQELAGFISTEVNRANTLITRFLQFARPLQIHPRNCDLSEVIDHAIDQLEHNHAHGDVTIHRNYSPAIGPLALDPELMESVFYNLILNAAQATPAGGTVSVKTRVAPGRVEIAVHDRGVGIPAENLEDIFNPFFTTKPQGVGLGLALVSKIVDEHGGKITVESEVAKGSVFRVYLPIRPEDAEAAQSAVEPGTLA